jgi:energy-coupling factor transporter ATP-binding protein EcfA2
MIAGLTISGLTLTRGERTLFRGLDLGLKAGDAIALTGANGAGKTSLLRAIAGFLRPEAGSIVFSDADANAIEASEARAHEVHMLGHLDGLKGGRVAREELMFQSQWLGRSHDGIDSAGTKAVDANVKGNRIGNAMSPAVSLFDAERPIKANTHEKQNANRISKANATRYRPKDVPMRNPTAKPTSVMRIITKTFLTASEIVRPNNTADRAIGSERKRSMSPF